MRKIELYSSPFYHQTAYRVQLCLMSLVLVEQWCFEFNMNSGQQMFGSDLLDTNLVIDRARIGSNMAPIVVLRSLACHIHGSPGPPAPSASQQENT